MGGLDKLSVTETGATKFIHYKHDPEISNSLSNNSVWAIYEDHSQNLWIATLGGGLNRFDRQTERFTHYKHDPNDPHSLSVNEVWSIYEDQFGTLLIGTFGGGLNIYDPQTDKFTHFKHDPNDPTSLSSDTPYKFYEDKSQRLWIGTVGGGICKFDRRQQKFIHTKNDPKNPHSLSSNLVMAFHEDRSERLWVGTWDGLNRFDPDTKQFTHYEPDPNNPNSLSHNTIYAIHEDQSGNLWIGTWGGGLNKLDPQTEKFAHYKHDPANPNSLSDDYIQCIYEDISGNLWIGTNSGGLNKFDPGTGKFTHYKHDPGNSNSISHNNVEEIYGDRSGTLWIGTIGGGLNKLDPQTEKFTHYKFDPKNANSISDNSVYAIHEDEAGSLWIGTLGGLNKLDRKTGEFTHYFEEDGLPNNGIMGILGDEQGNLWLSTIKGLSKFNDSLPDKKFRNYDVKDGLQSNEFNHLAYYKSRRGEFFFGGVNGFNRFYPEQVKDNPLAPSILLTAFKKFNEPARLDTAISEVKEIRLSYDENYFSFEFAALDYTIPEKNQYAYMMEGFDKDWIYPGTRRFAGYTNVDPGDYIFRVKGSNNDGVWNEEGTAVKITILPPWWRTTGAYVAYMLLAALILYGLRRFDLNRVKIRNKLKMKEFEAQKLQEVDHLKSRFFANISHEFRTPLTLILGPLEDVIAKIKNRGVKNDLRMMQRNANRVLQLINQLLDLSRLEAGKMKLNAQRGDLIGFIKGIVMSFASRADQKKISLNFDVNDVVAKHASPLREIHFDRDKIEKIFYNLLSNAFKFTPERGTVSVNVSALRRGERPLAPTPGVSEHIRISVKDTGIGIPTDRLPHIFDRFYQVDSTNTREHEGTGIGRALTKELVELHHGEIEAHSEEGKGTEFLVHFPLGKDHLQPDEMVKEPSEGLEQQPSFQGFVQEDEALEDLTVGAIEPSEDLDDDATIILVVDDHPDVRNYVRKHLEPDYHILEAKDGEEGVAAAIETIPDLVISDVMMPKMDGYQLCESLKTNEKTSHIPVILLTAKAGEEDKLIGLETGADDYLTKPFNSKELHARVHNLIELRQKLRERYRREGLLQPREASVTSIEEAFTQKMMGVIEEHLADEDFGIERLCDALYIGKRQLQRKIRALTGQTPTDFIRSVRLQRAKLLLEQHAGTVSEIAYDVGFNDLSYFSKSFRKEFGLSPSEMTEKK